MNFQFCQRCNFAKRGWEEERELIRELKINWILEMELKLNCLNWSFFALVFQSFFKCQIVVCRESISWLITPFGKFTNFKFGENFFFLSLSRRENNYGKSDDESLRSPSSPRQMNSSLRVESKLSATVFSKRKGAIRRPYDRLTFTRLRF